MSTLLSYGGVDYDGKPDYTARNIVVGVIVLYLLYVYVFLPSQDDDSSDDELSIVEGAGSRVKLTKAEKREKRAARRNMKAARSEWELSQTFSNIMFWSKKARTDRNALKKEFKALKTAYNEKYK